MSRPIDVGLKQIKTLLLKMGDLAKDTLALSLRGFFDKEDVYLRVKSGSNMLLILSEEVQDKVTEQIALYQPMAGDLRVLRAYIKIAYDFERFGRYAFNISDIVYRLSTWKNFHNGKLSLKEIGKKVQEIVNLSVKLIETQDQSLFWKMSKLESEIDSMYIKDFDVLVNSADIEAKTTIATVLFIRYLERIADHACYIGESISYAQTGQRISLR
jgi:phosphate transport system protein